MSSYINLCRKLRQIAHHMSAVLTLDHTVMEILWLGLGMETYTVMTVVSQCNPGMLEPLNNLDQY